MELDTRGQPGVRASRPRRPAPAYRPAARLRAVVAPTAGLAVAGLAAGLALAPALPAGATARGRQTIGGPQLAGHGVIVNYPAAKARPLPKVKASAYVIADAAPARCSPPRTRTAGTCPPAPSRC